MSIRRIKSLPDFAMPSIGDAFMVLDADQTGTGKKPYSSVYSKDNFATLTADLINADFIENNLLSGTVITSLSGVLRYDNTVLNIGNANTESAVNIDSKYLNLGTGESGVNTTYINIGSNSSTAEISGNVNFINGELNAIGDVIRIGNNGINDVATASILIGSNVGNSGDSPTQTSIKGKVSLSGASTYSTLAPNEKSDWQSYFDVPSNDVMNRAIRTDLTQTFSPAEQAQARANIGVVTAAGGASVGSGGVWTSANPPPVGAARTVAPTVVWNGASTQYARVKLSSRRSGDLLFAPEPGLWLRFDGANLVASGFETLYNVVICPASAVPVGEWVDLVLVNSVDAVTVYVNGVSVGSAVPPPLIWEGAAAGIGRISSAQYAEMATFNYALNATERAALRDGAWTAAMRQRGYVLGFPAVSLVSGDGVFEQGSNGFEFYYGTMPSIVAVVPPPLPFDLRPGDTLRVRFTATATGEIGCDASNDGTKPFTADANTITFSVTTTTNQPNLFFHLDATNYISNYVFEVLGCAGRWEPRNCTAHSWLDSSGNDLHLVFALGTGMYPIAPLPRQRYGFNVVYNMATMQVIDGASLPPGWSITKPNTGVLHVIAPDYVRDGASLRVDAVSEGDPPSRVTCSGYGYRDAGQAQQYYLYVDALDAPHAPVDAVLSLSVSYDD